MDNSTSFLLQHSVYFVKRLYSENADIIQKLYEQCIDFAYFTEGKPSAPTAAFEEFKSVPEGKTTQDKYIFGLFDINNILLGMIESIRHYPNHETWWIGLMLLYPKQQHLGLGTDFYQAFENWVSLQRIQFISLAVIQYNEAGLKFWKKMGFLEIRQTSRKQFGHKTHTLYVMQKKLNQSS